MNSDRAPAIARYFSLDFYFRNAFFFRNESYGQDAESLEQFGG